MDRGARQDTGGAGGRTMDPGDRRPFEPADPGALGYHRKQVDRFMARARTAYEGGGGLRAADIRHVSFDAVQGGYRADQVDDVLDRLEDALARSERERRIKAEGEESWQARVEASVEVLTGRLERPDGDRFRRPVGDEGYDRAEVDALCHRLADRLGGRGQGSDLAADDVRRAVFSAAPADRGYDEAQVDAYLDAAIDVLSVLD